MADTLEKNPFPGLRPFEEHEESYFFGREKAVTDLTSQLRTSCFLAVIGTSGSGKSSLITAGLLPALYRGLMVKAGSHWRVAMFRPGNNPIGNLARILSTTFAGRQSPDDTGSGTGADAGGIDPADRFLEVTLRRSDRGLIDAVRQAQLPPNENLLIVVDQFEELFRFSRLEQANKDGKRDSAAFVKLLLETREQNDLPIYIILTMRSDFLGDCTVFAGLAEAVNKGQYLVPRMTREEKRAAVTGPIKVEGGAISTPLMSRLLNDVGDNPDQLPILQHALMRTWDYWTRHRRGGEPMDIPHYEAIGAMEQALSQHAEEAFAELKNDSSRLVCQKLFKLITDVGETGRGVRRPARVEEICKAADASKKKVTEVVDLFRKPGRTFLMPPHNVKLDEDSVIDISHESFMRIWERLTGWVKEESQSAELYQRLAKSAALYEEGKVGLWRDPELMLALNWREENRPNAVWADRYDSSFPRATAFLDASKNQRDLETAEKEREQRAKIRRTRIFAAVIGLAAVISIVFGIWALKSQEKAQEQRLIALEQKEKAQDQQKLAEKQKKIAEEQKREAEIQRQEALRQQERAEEQKKIAEINEKTAKRAEARAQKNERIAIVNQKKERIQALIVDMKKEESGFRQHLAKAQELAVQSTAQKTDPQLRALLALEAYRLNRGAYGTLKTSTKKRFDSFDKNSLAGNNKELVNAYRQMEGVYNTLQNKSRGKSVPPQVFSALRDAYIANRESRDIICPGVESWALAAPGGNTILFNNMDQELLAVSLPPRELVIPPIHKQPAVRLPGSPMLVSSLLDSEDRLFCGSVDGRMVYWEKKNWNDMKRLANHGEKILAMAYARSKNQLFYSIGNTVYRLQPGTPGEPERVLRFDPGVFTRALFVIGPPGRSILIAADSKGDIFYSLVRDGAMEKKRLNAEMKPGGIYAAAWEPKRKRLALGNANGEIQLFSNLDIRSPGSGGKYPSVTFKKTHKGIVRALAFCPDGRFLASGGYDGTVMLWDLKGKSELGIVKQLPILTVTGTRKILSILFVNNGETMIFSDSQHLRMCPTRPGPLYKALLKKKIRDFHPDERQYYIGDKDSTGPRRKK